MGTKNKNEMKNHRKVQTEKFFLPPHHKCLLQPDALPDKKVRNTQTVNEQTNKQTNKHADEKK